MYELNQADVPDGLKHGGKELPLGRYLRRHLRSMIGRDEKIPQEAFDQMAAELWPLRLAARSSQENPSLKGQILASNVQAFRNFESRVKLKQNRRYL